MNKQEFVDRLRVSLSGRISPVLVEENTRYYEDYINTQVRLGEAEENVLEGLGDPRLIARSIVAAESVKKEDADGSRTYGGEEDAARRNVIRRFFRTASLPAWALPVMAAGLLILVFAVLGLILSLVLQVIAWLWPLIAIAMIVIFFIKLFRDWLH